MVKLIFGKKAMSLPVLVSLIIIALTLIFIVGALIARNSAIFGG